MWRISDIQRVQFHFTKSKGLNPKYFMDIQGKISDCLTVDHPLKTTERLSIK